MGDCSVLFLNTTALQIDCEMWRVGLIVGDDCGAVFTWVFACNVWWMDGWMDVWREGSSSHLLFCRMDVFQVRSFFSLVGEGLVIIILFLRYCSRREGEGMDRGLGRSSDRVRCCAACSLALVIPGWRDWGMIGLKVDVYCVDGC